MLAAVGRLGRGDDKLAEALRAGPPPEADLDPVELALAYVVAAIRIPRPEWDAGEIPRLAAPVLTATRYLRALPPERAAAAFSRLVKLLEVSNSVAVLRGRAALLCIGVTICRMMQDERSWRTPDAAAATRTELIRLFELLPRWGTDWRRDARPSLAHALGDLVAGIMPAVGDDAAEGWADRLAATTWQARNVAPGSVASVLYALGRRLSERSDATPLAIARGHRFATMAAAMLGDERTVRHDANAVDSTVVPFAGERDFELERVQAWRYVAYAHQNDAAVCESAARHVDELARPFAGDRDFELERVQAWRYVAYAHQNDAAACELAARHVDELARPFAGERDFELERVQAWRYVAYAHQNDAAACELAARHVDELGRPFAGERDFEYQRVQAWCYVAYAHRDDAAVCELAARHVDELARPFAGERDFELEREQVRRLVGSAPDLTRSTIRLPRL